MNTEITETISGWVLYDGTCSICCDGIGRVHGVLVRHGLHPVPLQARWVTERLGMNAGEPFVEIKLLLRDGRILGGADALIEIARIIWWACPFFVFSVIPGARSVLRWLYRQLAANRHCYGGKCRARETARREPASISSAFYELP